MHLRGLQLCIFAATATLGIAAADRCRSDCVLDEEIKLLAADGAAGDRLGYSLAISGDFAIAGATQDDDNGEDAGAAYLFEFEDGQWGEQEKLLASDGTAGDGFGVSVAIFGDVAIVGAWFDDDDGMDSGSAYLFRFDGTAWVEEARLLPSDGAAGEYFGIAVAAAADRVVVGAGWDEENGAISGAAYVYCYDNGEWIEEEKLMPADGSPGANFGISAAISSDVVVIGARWDIENGTDSGAAYVFRRDGGAWTEEAKLLASDGTPYDRFGSAVSVAGDLIAVGAIFDDDIGLLAGSAYLFRYVLGEWIEEVKLAPAGASSGDGFGNSVAVSGDIAAIGAYNLDYAGDNSGAVYIFRYVDAEWIEAATLAPSDGAEWDFFGYSVAFSGAFVAAGAILDDDLGSESGAVYLFSPLSCPVHFVRGDADADGDFGIDDALATLTYLFSAGEPPPCLLACDANSDDALNLADPIAWLQYLFLNGFAPEPPFPECGISEDPRSPLPCASFPACE
ncbi:MAG: FG-GAP repeat protein [Planctomycetes bacterium]|nr:FG-GAP repeat protein [Planctomycetota bacterium]